MTLPTSGTILLSQIRSELGESGVFSIGRPHVRALAKRASAEPVRASDFYGKVAGPLDSLLTLSGMYVAYLASDDASNRYYVGYVGTVAAPNACMVKLSPTGTVLWVKTIDALSRFYCVCYSGSFVYATGFCQAARGVNDFSVFKFSVSGDLLKVRTYHAGANTYSSSNSICSVGTVGEVIVGCTIPVGTLNKNFCLKLDAELNVITQITLPVWPNNLKVRNSHVYCSGSTGSKVVGYLYKMTEDLVFVNSFMYENVGETYNFTIQNFDVDALNNVYVGGMVEAYYYGNISVLFKHSSSGTFAWKYPAGTTNVDGGVVVDPATQNVLTSSNSGGTVLYLFNPTGSLIWTSKLSGSTATARLFIEGDSFLLYRPSGTASIQFRAPLSGLKLGTYGGFTYSAPAGVSVPTAPPGVTIIKATGVPTQAVATIQSIVPAVSISSSPVTTSILVLS